MTSHNPTTGACPICGCREFTPLFQVPFPDHSKSPGKGFPLEQKLDVPAWRIVRCHDCSVEYPNPRPSEESIRSYYANQLEPSDWEVENYVDIPQRGRDSWAHFAKLLTALRGKPGSLLEVGCAAGWLLEGARKGGWKVKGIEASPKFQKYASSVLKLPVELGTLESADLNGEIFDVVVMTDVIEHLIDPVSDLQRVRNLMAPDGYLVLATCDIGSLCARFWGLNWRQIVISHTFYWTKRSMAEALRRAGFRIERISEPRYWHPNRTLELVQRVREIAKLLARFALLKTYIPAAKRWSELRALVETFSFGRLNHDDLLHRIGDQPVLGDVMLVIARPDSIRSAMSLMQRTESAAVGIGADEMLRVSSRSKF
jgi:2-polyprenyl-3-methyl-5-hydroxy-6-metoxy-1,4-benzoquinol methylase